MREARRTKLRAVLACLAVSLFVTACGGEDAPPTLTSGSLSLVDQGWYCSGEVDVDRLEITIEDARTDAIHLGRGCTGRIGEIHVVQHQLDGVKISEGAHDVVIERGTIRCEGQRPGSHQDGVQAMSGSRITFRELRIECPTRSSGFFVRLGGSASELPTDIVCEECYIAGGGYSVRINESVRSGVRDSVVCDGRFGGIQILDGAVDPVDQGNRRVSCD
jgi:hypothetical protein